MSGDTSGGRLSEPERRRVADNLRLVTVHLRERVSARGAPTRHQEWEDLFQEGCCGLIQAVRSYPPDSDIPFAAYALPRIHTAVSRAMRGGFATVKQPLYPRKAEQGADTTAAPRTVSIDFDPQDRRPSLRHEPDRPPAAESIGDRIRARYTRAIGRAADRTGRTRPARADRAELIRRIVDQRLLVPEPDDRVSLRAIARDTGSSYARVAQCDKRLTELTRLELTDDLETQHLRRVARRSDEGMAAPVDAALLGELHNLLTGRFLDKLATAPLPRRGAMLLELIEHAGTSPEAIGRLLLERMTGRQREALFCALQDEG